MKSHVFVSHASTDAAAVLRLREALEPEVKLWVDRRELVGGDDLDSEIRAAIDDARHLIVVLSLGALNSAWVKKELEYAREVQSRRGTDHLRIIPVLRPPFKPEMTSFILGEDIRAIPLADAPGGLDKAVAEIRVALRLELPETVREVEVPEEKPLADLLLELTESGIREADDTRRATARARLVYVPADGGQRVTSGSFEFTAPPIEADDLAWYLERYILWPSAEFQERARTVEAKLPEWGQLLYETLLHDKTRGAVGAWRRVDGASRRFSVLVDADSNDGTVQEGAAILLSLPWELVHDEKGYLFQGRRGVRVRRQLPKREEVDPLVTKAPIRVLLVSPRPEDDRAGYIDHRVSAKPLVEILGPLGELAEFSILQPPTFKAMSAQIREASNMGRPYQVVHFDGHGVYNKKLGLGALCFEDPADTGKLTGRRTATVQADKIAAVMRDHRVPLVFLEACQSAMSDGDPTASVAGQLLDMGVASVVAMSHTVLVETARRFVAPFYTSLVRGERVGEAMLAGQRELADDSSRGKSFFGEFHLQDWFVPVLYQEDADPPLIESVPDERVQRVMAQRRQLALGELPSEPDHRFVGRSSELLALERLLLDNRKEVEERYAVVLGGAGEGKTTLAAEFGRWLVATRRFARAAFVSLESALDARSVLHALGNQLVAEFAVEAGKEPEKAVLLVERALREQATVIVLDNVETILPPPPLKRGGSGMISPQVEADVFEPEVLAAILALFARLQNAGEKTCLVFTSREALPSPFQKKKNTVRIGRLTRAEAVLLVGNVLDKEDLQPKSTDSGESENEIDRLVDAVDRHARSLVLVAREVASSGVRGATEQLEGLMESMAKRWGDDREWSLFASVELSLRRLPEATRRRLPRLGVFRGGGQLQFIGQVLGLAVDNNEEVLLGRQLVDVGLGELLDYGHLRLHPALGPLLRSELDEAELEEARRVWVKAMVGLVAYLNHQQPQNAQLATSLTVLELPNLLPALEQLQATGSAEKVVDVATKLEGLLQNLGRPRALARVVRVREAMSPGVKDWSSTRFEAESAAVDRLLEDGRVTEALDAAHSVLRRALAAGKHAYKGAAYHLAIAHFRLGRGLSHGNAEAALILLGEARQRFQKLADIGHRGAARMVSGSISEIGDCLSHLGKLDEAAAAYEEAIDLDKARDDLRGVAVSKGQLGTVRRLQKRYQDALNAHHEARKAFERLGEPGSVAAAWHQIGRIYEDAEQYEAAERAYQQSLKIRVQHSDRPGEASTLTQLGNVYGLIGRMEDAVRFYRQSGKIYTELGDSLNEGLIRSNAAILLIYLERYEEARQETLQAIECKKSFGHEAKPWKTFDILHDLECAVGNASAAETARTDAIAAFLAYRRADGESHETDAQLAAAVAQAVTSGETTATASQLSELVRRPGPPDYLQALVSVLLQILNGSRDPALAEDPGLFYTSAVEVRLLLDRLS